jgi:hypothetical protein
MNKVTRTSELYCNNVKLFSAQCVYALIGVIIRPWYGPGSSVSIATGYGLDGPGIE